MDITSTGPGILKQNRAMYVRQLPSEHAERRIAAIDAELARRKERKATKGGTSGYVLTATGQFEHHTGSREGFTRCGVAIAPDRTYGTRDWWHCLLCGG